LVIVVRYFGGTKLGTGGLIQAYKTAAQEAIEDAGVVEDEWLDKVLITCDYQDLPQVMMILKQLSAVKMDLQQSENCQLSYLLSPGKTKQLMAHSVAWKSAEVKISPVI
jgi:putative IMPACT (imprinted ancient) family translation regulator